MTYAVAVIVLVLVGVLVYVGHLSSKATQLDQARKNLQEADATIARLEEAREVKILVDSALDWVYTNRSEFRRLLLDAAKTKEVASIS